MEVIRTNLTFPCLFEVMISDEVWAVASHPSCLQVRQRPAQRPASTHSKSNYFPQTSIGCSSDYVAVQHDSLHPSAPLWWWWPITLKRQLVESQMEWMYDSSIISHSQVIKRPDDVWKENKAPAASMGSISSTPARLNIRFRWISFVKLAGKNGTFSSAVLLDIPDQTRPDHRPRALSVTTGATKVRTQHSLEWPPGYVPIFTRVLEVWAEVAMNCTRLLQTCWAVLEHMFARNVNK